MKLHNKRAIMFDFDGTIVDSMSAFADIAAEVMSKYLPIEAKEARRRYLETSGIPFFQQLEVIFPGNDLNRKTANEFEAKKLEGYYDEPLYDDAIETIARLRSSGLFTVISSNNFQELVDRFVEKKSIKFDVVLGFKEGFEKGADHFRYIERLWQLTKNEIIFVGDSIKDGERAIGYGIEFIGKEGTFTGDEFSSAFPGSPTIKNLSELCSLFTD